MSSQQRNVSSSGSVDEAINFLMQAGATEAASRSAFSEPARKFRTWFWPILLLLLPVALVGAMYVGALRAPSDFPAGSYISVAKGMTLQEISELLDEKNFIRSSFLFKVFSTLLGGETGLKAGEYYFSRPLSVAFLSWRLTQGKFELVPLKVTIPEGLHNREVASLLKDRLPRLNEKRFLSLAAGKEGELFPDTYFFLPSTDETEAINALSDTFTRRIELLQNDIARFGQPMKDVIIMASLLEEEARTMESRRTIAGILWKRLDIGMPLQVDAVFPYFLGKNTYEITTEDLQADSPYNTYKYAGLPPGAISNPGLDSIRAAITPIETPYFYYLTDGDGNMRYARTPEDHGANKEKYLK